MKLENDMKRIANTAGMLGIMGCAVMAAPNALADDSFWYLGANIGQSKAKIDDARVNAQLVSSGLTTSSITDDDSDPAYKLFGGYQYNKHLAVEFGYFDLGRFGYTATTVPAGTLDGKIKLKGVNLDLVGLWPLSDKFSAFGRLGVNYAQAKDSFVATGAVDVPTDANPGKSGANYKAGVGVQYDLTEALGLRAEGERYRISDGVGNKGDINMISLGLIYRFGEKKAAPVEKAETPPPVAEAPVAEVAEVAPAPPMESMLVIVPVKVMTQEYCSVLDLQFEIKGEDIQRDDKEKLAVVGTFMNKYPSTTAVIEGHADNVGTSEFNQKLSQHRAESVVSYLIDDLHIAASRLSAVGYGDTRPIADNSTDEGKQANRRIAAVIACATDIEGLKVTPARLTMAMEIDFDPYKAEIAPHYFDRLNEIAKFLRANPSVTATVEGHAGTRVGKVHVSAADAMKVSHLRAQAVVDYLADKQGISRSRLSTLAFGQTRRVSYGTTLEGQQENRRVNIIFNYKKN